MLYELQSSPRARDKAIQTIRNGNPVGVETYTNHGDGMVASWPWILAVKRLCEEEGLDDRGVQFVNCDTQNCRTKGISLPNLLDPVPPGMTKYYYGVNYTYNQRMILRRLRSILELTNITERDFERVPEPVKRAGSCFEEFDIETMYEQAQELKDKHFKSSRVIAIAQFVGHDAKRFSDEDAVTIAQLVKRKHPNALVARISDGYFSRNENRGVVFHNSSSPVDFTITPGDITQACAAFYCVTYLITTDSFGSHLGFGCMAKQPEKDGVLSDSDGIVLFTIADPSKYSVGNTQSVVSPTMKEVLSSGKPIFGHIISEEEYRIKNCLEKSQISPRDFNAFLQELEVASMY